MMAAVAVNAQLQVCQNIVVSADSPTVPASHCVLTPL